MQLITNLLIILWMAELGLNLDCHPLVRKCGYM